MNNNFYFYLCIVVAFLLCLWIGWYSIIVVVAFAIICSIYIYLSERKRKKASIGQTVFAGVALSAFGAIIVVICMLFKGCVLDNHGPSYERIERRTKIHTPDGDKMPTMSEQGEYHNAGTGERQIEYGGSIEQKRDIEAADRLIENGY